MYRAVDTGLRTIDVQTLTEAANILGANQVDNHRAGDLSQHHRRGAVGRLPDARHRHRRVHHREPAQPAGLRRLHAERRRQPRLRAGGARRHLLRHHLGRDGHDPACSPASPPRPPARTDANGRGIPPHRQARQEPSAATPWSRTSTSRFEQGRVRLPARPLGLRQDHDPAHDRRLRAPRPPARILVEGKDITALPPNQRKIGMVFQAYALFPNMNVADNIGFGLKIAGMPAAAARARGSRRCSSSSACRGYGKRYPFELSGGQQQRVALARALAPQPAHAAARRAAVGARRQDPRVAARADPRHPARARHHHRLRHPRPGRGAVDLGPHRGAERRAASSSSARRSRSTTGRRPGSSPPSWARSTRCRPRSPTPASKTGRHRRTRGDHPGPAGHRADRRDDGADHAARGRVARQRRAAATSCSTARCRKCAFLGSVIRLKVDLGDNAVQPRHLQRPAHPAAGLRRSRSGSASPRATCWCSTSSTADQPAASRPVNILLITADQWRGDAVGYAGNPA